MKKVFFIFFSLFLFFTKTALAFDFSNFVWYFVMYEAIFGDSCKKEDAFEKEIEKDINRLIADKIIIKKVLKKIKNLEDLKKYHAFQDFKKVLLKYGIKGKLVKIKKNVYLKLSFLKGEVSERFFENLQKAFVIVRLKDGYYLYLGEMENGA